MDKGLALFLPALALSLNATEPIIVARSSIPAYILGNFFQFSTQPPTSGKLALTQKKQEINAAGQLLHNLTWQGASFDILDPVSLIKDNAHPPPSKEWTL